MVGDTNDLFMLSKNQPDLMPLGELFISLTLLSRYSIVGLESVTWSLSLVESREDSDDPTSMKVRRGTSFG